MRAGPTGAAPGRVFAKEVAANEVPAEGVPDLAALVGRARSGDPRATARLLTRVENGRDTVRDLAAAVPPDAGQAWVIGITGAPGVGKSTSTSALVTSLRARGLRVAVLAVDPSSPFSGGALLGDRIRMQEHATDPGVFIRSMASRGHLGGLAAATPQAVRVLEAAGFDIVLVETVGVGQSEIEIAATADTTVVMLAPGMGDGIQAAKAGILEIGDVFVVNKADREGAAHTVRDLRHMISLGAPHEPGRWRPPVVATTATRREGVDELVEALQAHRDWARGGGELERRRRRRAVAEIEALVLALLRRRIEDRDGSSAIARLADDVAAGRRDPHSAAEEVIALLAADRA